MIIRPITILGIIVLLSSCSKKILLTQGISEDRRKASIDYSNIDNWAAHPFKNDPADSVPKPLRSNYKHDTLADVFFIHPTTYFDKKLLETQSNFTISDPYWNASLESSNLNIKTDESTILYQASIFNEDSKIFAPRYRQVNYYAYYTTDKANAIKAFDFAYEDIKHSFEFYLKHYNKGRPIIIAAHSQGTTHAKRLIKEIFEAKPLMNQLVVAYLIGMPIEENYFKSIPPCTNPSQTGCIVSWRTFREGYMSDFAKKENFNAIVTNPLSWDTSGVPVERKYNKGSVLLNFNKVIPGTSGGRVYKNVLWVNKPKFFGSFISKEKNYHVGDLNLFYMNVRENVKQRINVFIKK